MEDSFPPPTHIHTGKAEVIMTAQENAHTRIVAIRHLVKKGDPSKDSPEDKATTIVIRDGSRTTTLTLDSVNAEIDFMRGEHPVSFRGALASDDPKNIPNPRHMKWRVVKEDEIVPEGTPEHHIETTNQKGVPTTRYLTEVANAFEGIRAHDEVVGTLAGVSLSYIRGIMLHARKAGLEGVRVFGVIPAHIKDMRAELEPKKPTSDAPPVPDATAKPKRPTKKDKRSDAHVLIMIATERRNLMTEIADVHATRIHVNACVTDFLDTQRDRIRASNRALGRERTTIYEKVVAKNLGADVDLEAMIEANANASPTVVALLAEEKERAKELEGALKADSFYKSVLSQVTGMGPLIAGRIIGIIMLITRFATPSKLVAYAGVHPRDGKLVKHTKGERGGFNTVLRQAMYLFIQSVTKLPTSEWGMRQRALKVAYAARHPDLAPAKIHSAGSWSMANLFLHWLWGAWYEHDTGATPTQTKSVASMMPAFRRMDAEGKRPLAVSLYVCACNKRDHYLARKIANGELAEADAVATGEEYLDDTYMKLLMTHAGMSDDDVLEAVAKARATREQKRAA